MNALYEHDILGGGRRPLKSPVRLDLGGGDCLEIRPHPEGGLEIRSCGPWANPLIVFPVVSNMIRVTAQER